MFTVSVAVLLSVGHVTVTVTGTGPSCIGAVHGVCRPVGVVNVSARALQAYATEQPIESSAVADTVETLPTSTVHGSHCAVTDSVCCGGGGGGGGAGGGGGGTEARPPRGYPTRTREASEA